MKLYSFCHTALSTLWASSYAALSPLLDWSRILIHCLHQNCSPSIRLVHLENSLNSLFSRHPGHFFMPHQTFLSTDTILYSPLTSAVLSRATAVVSASPNESP